MSSPHSFFNHPSTPPVPTEPHDLNNWTDIKEKKLLDWQQQSKLHSLGHIRAQEVYTKKNTVLQIPSIIFGAIAVFSDGIALLWHEYHTPFIITALLLTAMATILDGILQTTKPSDVASCHADMAKGYNRLILQIDSALTKEYDERANGITFLNMIEQELIALKTGNVSIPLSIWNTIKKDFLEGRLDFVKIDDKPLCPSVVEVSDIPAPDILKENLPVGTNNVPSFELRVMNDSELYKGEQTLFDYQMNRLG